MATFNISAGDVNGLVAAIKSANANSEADIIELAAGVYDASTYTTTDRTTDTDFLETGSGVTNAFPVIRSEITINGAGAATTVITREDVDFLRLFIVAAEGTLRLNDVTLRKGDVGEADTVGGAVYNKGAFEAERSVFMANKSAYGGAIRNDGTAQITDSQVIENWSGWGGGLYNTGTMTVETSLISDNESPDGGGIINYGALTVQGSIVAANRGIYGGGIGNYGGSSAVSASTISHNNASEGGGGLYNRVGEMSVQGSSITNNTSPVGSAVLNEDLTTTVDAEMNWWGSADGPGIDDVAGLVSTVDYETTEPESAAYGYNRSGAAELAAQTAISNFLNFPYSLTGDVVTTTENAAQRTIGALRYSTVGGDYWYQAGTLAHVSNPDAELNKTGSSIFVSEMVHLGGDIPMLLGSSGPVSCDVSGTVPELGWRACVEEVEHEKQSYCVADSITTAWKRHEDLKNYLTSSLNPAISTILSFTDLNIIPVSGLHRLKFAAAAGTLNDEVPVSLTDFQTHVYGIFNAEAYGAFRTGDYVYLNLGTGVSHGLLIVGWGPAVECPAGLNAPLVSQVVTTSADGQYQLARAHDTIPYIVDLGYSYNSGVDATGWQQDPRPRPFYCTALTIDNTGENEKLLYYHLDRLGAADLESYLEKLRGNYLPYVPQSGLHPAWQFIHFPNEIPNPYGIVSDCP